MPMKNANAVALGRLGGLKGGPLGGRARALSLSPERRRAIAQLAAQKRWGAAKTKPKAAAKTPLPLAVAQLLKTYDVAKLNWMNDDDRYAIVREIVRRGSRPARTWLNGMLSESGVRELLRQYAGAGFNEPERKLLRKRYLLTKQDVPERAFLGFEWDS